MCCQCECVYDLRYLEPGEGWKVRFYDSMWERCHISPASHGAGGAVCMSLGGDSDKTGAATTASQTRTGRHVYNDVHVDGNIADMRL